MRFLGDRPGESVSLACVDFCGAMVKKGREIFVAAPTLAEITRYQGRSIPRTKGVTVVPFDDRAAEILGLQLPMAKLHEAKLSTGRTLTYLKYDAMIAACAVRCGAKVMVAIDGDHVELLRYLKFPVHRPDEYVTTQTEMFQDGV